MEELLNNCLQELQNETPNCGGRYHFSKIILDSKEEDKNLFCRIKNYLSQFDAYEDNCEKSLENNVRANSNDRCLENFQLEEIIDLDRLIISKLEFWKNHRTTLDCRENVTDKYQKKEDNFRCAFSRFIRANPNNNSYIIKGIDTYFSFGGDHVNDDILIETEKEIYILHFGWSS